MFGVSRCPFMISFLKHKLYFDFFDFFINPSKPTGRVLLDLVSSYQHVWCVSDDLLTAKEKNKKLEEEMEAAFQDIQNM